MLFIDLQRGSGQLAAAVAEDYGKVGQASSAHMPRGFSAPATPFTGHQGNRKRPPQALPRPTDRPDLLPETLARGEAVSG